MTYAEKLLDPRWQKKRLDILNRDQFTCQICGDTTTTLHVHHDYYEKGKNPWEVDEWSLTTLCAGCHTMQHSMKTRIEKFLLTCLITRMKNGGEDIKGFSRCINNIVENKDGYDW